MSKEQKEISLKLTERTIEPKTIRIPYVIVDHPYTLVEDRNGRRHIRIKSRRKVFFYYAWSWTGIKWFLKLYNKDE